MSEEARSAGFFYVNIYSLIYSQIYSLGDCMADISAALLAGPLGAAELLRRLDISQATLSRRLGQHDQVVKWGKARATRYALLRPIRGESRFSVYQVQPSGQAEQAGWLLPTWPQGSCLHLDAGERGTFYEGVPWFLSDMRPQGFLGRLWGREHAAMLGLPEDIRAWSDEQCLLALAQNGINMPGDLILGSAAYQRWLLQPVPVALDEGQKRIRYPQLAEQALEGDEAGSSAGGEQPKFLCYATTSAGNHHCLVKFTLARQGENSRRWRDLLRAEHLALQQLQSAGLAAARSQLMTVGEQLFLEVERFDRIGERGRRGLCSLEALSAEFLGRQQHWPDALRELVRQQRLDEASLHRGTLQWAFGRLIANSDMHAGNLSFFTDGERLQLTPAYDMLPMALAPNSLGHMRDEVNLTLDFSLPGDVWRAASTMAQRYWQTIAADEVFSEEFRQIARQAQQQLTALELTLDKMA